MLALVTTMPTTAVQTLPVVAIDEDVVREALIRAIAVIEHVKHKSPGGWFAINHTGQMFLLNAQARLNAELNALLRGTYVQFCAAQLRDGARKDRS